MIKKRFVNGLVVLGVAIMCIMAFSACDTNEVEKRVVIKGIVTEKPVHEPVEMMSMEEMMAMRAEQEGEQGEQAGPGGPPGMEGGPPGFGGGSDATPAVYIDNGKYLEGKSEAGAVAEGEFGDEFASEIKITSEDADTGGVFVEGLRSKYTISNADIDLSGDGGFGLAGPGSGASAEDYATLIIRNSDITTSGENRNATAAQNYGILKVYNSSLTANGAPFEPDITNTEQKKQLEIDGNSRTHVTLSNSYSYFYYCDVVANGWGALSTDGSQGFVYLEANNCTVKTLKSGYGTYADGMCHNYINNCDFDVASMAGIIAGEADITFKDTDAKCGTYFTLIHSIGTPDEMSTLNVTRGEITCGSPVVLVKSANAEIIFDDVKMVSESGVLVKSDVSVDPQAAKAANPQQDVYGIHVTFKDMDVEGDIDHSEDAENRDMTVYLESTSLKGAIKDAHITFDPLSSWTATADSNVTIDGNVNLEQVDAAEGVTINAVAGQSGTYTLESGGTLILKAS